MKKLKNRKQMATLNVSTGHFVKGPPATPNQPGRLSVHFVLVRKRFRVSFAWLILSCCFLSTCIAGTAGGSGVCPSCPAGKWAAAGASVCTGERFSSLCSRAVRRTPAPVAACTAGKWSSVTRLTAACTDVCPSTSSSPGSCQALQSILLVVLTEIRVGCVQPEPARSCSARALVANTAALAARASSEHSARSAAL